ncbi:hypothetical protein RI496_18720 [Aeromonas dhakensis]|uniref:hypothetical protein n=1 Tax=Aeromonas dhakensis TaxID=196024 RepID=UPI00342742C8
MTLYIRLEKLRFLVTEMRLALRLAQFAPTDADARMIARHILIRAVDFISHSRQLRKPLKQAGFNTVAFHDRKECYAAEFKESFQKVRDRLSAHVQDIKLGEVIELWNGVDASNSEFFVEGATEIYCSLQSLSITDFPTLTDFPELGDPAFEVALQAYRASGCKVQTVEMGADPLAMTRPNSTALINTTPIHARAGHLALIQRWMVAQAKLLQRFGAFPNVVRLLKGRMITDLVSACDCLITRDVGLAAPQRMDGLDALLAKEVSKNAIEHFKTVFRVEEEIAPYREIRNKVSSHLDGNVTVTLENLLKRLDDIDFEAGLGIYDKLRQVFEKVCRDVLFLRSYLADGQILNGVLGSGKDTNTVPFSDSEQPGRVVPQPERMDYSDESYSAKLEEWLSGESGVRERARSAFWQAFLYSPVVEEYQLVESLPGGGIRYEMRQLRQAHCFIMGTLKSETESSRIRGILELTHQCSNGNPDALTEILMRFARNPRASPHMSAIAICLGDLANWSNLPVRAHLMAGMSVASSLAVYTRMALLRIFVRTEGIARINRKLPTEAFSDVLGSLIFGLEPRDKLITKIFLASQFCDQQIASVMKPFETDYVDLQTDIVALVRSLTPEEEAARISEMVRRLVDTHDYVGICLYLYDELKNGDLNSLARDLVMMACDGIVRVAYHDQSRKHLCGCFLHLERYKEALSLADSLARSNPENPNFQILLAQVMTYFPECQDAARSLSGDIKRRYRLNDFQLAAIEAVSSDSNGNAENATQ